MVKVLFERKVSTMSVTSKKKKNEKQEHEGVSLRTIQICLIAGAVLFSAIMLFFTFFLSSNFQALTQRAEHHVELRKAALELMDASDYLTENAQRFTIAGDTRFLNAYFDEALNMQHRENAVAKLSQDKDCEAALKKLQDAMDNSVKLMDREYYAMRLVIEAEGITQYPDVLQKVKLSDEDAALSAQDKMYHATQMVLDNEYYMQKNVIRNDMKASLDELEKLAAAFDADSIQSLQKELTFVRVLIVIQAVGVIFLVWLTSHLGIHPILDAVEHIKENKRIRESGTSEFRYLVRAYNRMYDVYKKSLERLNFKASHDELTGVYNRSGYESVLSSIDLANTYMILVDIDDFKSINDTYGHEVGDKMLIKTANALKNNFRADDYICRIGGDEFAVFMVHASKEEQASIAGKITTINANLADTGDGLPAASISVGIVHGSESDDAETLFIKADEAMYHAKHSGKNTYSFS